MGTLYLFLCARYTCRKLPDIEAANHSFTTNLRQSNGRQYDKIRYEMVRIIHCLWWKWSNRGDIEETLVESEDAKNMRGGRMYGDTWQQLNKYYSEI